MFVCCVSFSSSGLGLCIPSFLWVVVPCPQKGAFPLLSYFPNSLNDDHGNEHRIRMNITEVQYHRGGLLSCVLSSPNAPPPNPPPLQLATPSPATRIFRVPEALLLGGRGVVRGGGGAEILLSSRNPCFNVPQDDNNFFKFHFVPALVFMLGVLKYRNRQKRSTKLKTPIS